MNSEFENHLQRQPMREIPPHWRARILANAQPAPSRWRDWLYPAPQAWAMLGAAWVVILILHLYTPNEPRRSADAYAGAPPSFATFQEQAEMMAKLLGPTQDDEPPAAAPAPPKPRTERERKQFIG